MKSLTNILQMFFSYYTLKERSFNINKLDPSDKNGELGRSQLLWLRDIAFLVAGCNACVIYYFATMQVCVLV